MKRPFLVLFLVLLLGFLPVSAQTNQSFKKGYHGFVELEGSTLQGKMQRGFASEVPSGSGRTPVINSLSDLDAFLEYYADDGSRYGEMVRVSTVHGYGWGNGVFLGLGLGYSASLKDDMDFISTFVDAKYNFVDVSASPFLEGRVGYTFDTMTVNHTGGLFVSGAAGVDFGRFGARLGYEFCPLAQQNRTYYALNRFFLSLAFNF